ncbi:MAG: sulfite exporter TauE/SafE family protein [Candidatus Thorarchaeota archaeon]
MEVITLSLLSIGIGIGIIASLVGISGGAFKTPILIIVFGLVAELAAAASLISALFVAVASSVGYYRQDTQLIGYKIGLLFVITTIPGAYFGVFLRTFYVNREMLRFIFGIVLLPVALKLLLAMPKGQNQKNEENRAPQFNQMSRNKVVIAIFAAFFAGALAGFIGLGGGTIIVPVLIMLLKFPMIAAAATSMFTMMFTSSAGTIMNYLFLFQTENITDFLFFGLTLGIGTLVGGLIGSKYAYYVDTAQLQRIFGFLLIFPLVTMMRLGYLLLDPSGSDYVLATIGNTIIWLSIGIPIWLLSSNYLIPRRMKERQNIEASPSPVNE